MDWKSMGTLIGLICVIAYTAIKEYRDYKRRKLEFELTEKAGLAPNPTRCQEHADAINELRDDIRRIKEHLGIV